MRNSRLHRLVKKADVERVRELLTPPSDSVDIDALDRNGFTPLMHAVQSPHADIELVRLLLARGASVEPGSSVIALALGGGDPAKVRLLLEAGADLRYRREGGYDALIDAVHGRDVLRDPGLIDLLQLLIANGVALSSVTTYQESALRVLSRIGRFDAVQLLLLAGADEDQLQWTPLIRAAAIGSLSDLEAVARSGAALEQADWWARTAWLVAIQTGQIDKARLLAEHGANTDARGRCGKPPLFYAVEGHHKLMLQWLLELGLDIEQTDEFGATALKAAVESGDVECADILLRAGADASREYHGQTALSEARSREVAMRLLEAGADPSHLSYEGRRALLGFAPDPDEDLLDASLAQFARGRSRRFGNGNPERMEESFWEGMIRAGVTGYAATQLYDGPSSFEAGPVWCAQRFGQSITFLPDGRVVQIAGEHEDGYDPDFCIYNDVFVHDADGTIRIFGYSESVFAPTDFHSATLIDGHIYVIGSLGYPGTRRLGETPVYRLSIDTFHIERVDARGDAPGWLYAHRAILCSAHEIRVSGGKIVSGAGEDEVHTDNQRCFVLDTRLLVWRGEPA